MKKQYLKLIYDNAEGITTITLNDKSKLNALGLEMQGELLGALRHGRDDKDTKVIIVTGAGEKAFCVGADINIFQGISSIEGYRLMRDLGYEIHRLMEIMEKPLIAAVNGYCLAGGLEVALACDFIIASGNAMFGAPEINIGIIPGWGGCVRLAQAIGKRRAKEWIMTGKHFSAKEVGRLGIVNKVVPHATLMAEARNFAEELATKAPNALKMAKMVVNLSLETADMDAALAIERSATSVLLGTKDCAEGITAFIEKRVPKFKGS